MGVLLVPLDLLQSAYLRRYIERKCGNFFCTRPYVDLKSDLGDLGSFRRCYLQKVSRCFLDLGGLSQEFFQWGCRYPNVPQLFATAAHWEAIVGRGEVTDCHQNSLGFLHNVCVFCFCFEAQTDQSQSIIYLATGSAHFFGQRIKAYWVDRGNPQVTPETYARISLQHTNSIQFITQNCSSILFWSSFLETINTKPTKRKQFFRL